MRIAILGGLLLMLAACGQKPDVTTPRVAADETARAITQGELIGFRTAKGVDTWLGVPFARPPVGDLRWRAPRSPLPWDGRLSALEHGERCAQMSNVYDRPEGLEPGLLVGSEDCLTLNIYAPENAAGGDLPVMVWIHGGGNVWGKASTYDPSNLVANEDVIVVTIQYRVGPLGWFAHGALRDSAETPMDESANFGILDQVAALEWVRENIASFGGDAQKVTVFGESAGGHNVVSLLASPAAEGLFQRAIIQSGSFDSFTVAEAEEGGDGVVNASGEIATKLGVTTAEELRALSLDDLFDAYNFADIGFIDHPRIISGDPVLPTPTLREAFSSTDTFNVMPIVTGTNKDEMKLFQALDPRLVRQWFGVIIVAKDQGFYDALSDYQSRIWRLRSVDAPALAMAEAGHTDVFAYRFDWDDGGKFLITDLKKLLGAAHAIEIPFVFNRFSFLGDVDPIMFSKKTASDREELSRVMGAYWASFARAGDPNGEAGRSANDRIDWPAYRPADDYRLIRFDTANDRGVNLIDEPETLNSLIADLNADPRVDEEEKCLIAGSLVEWAKDLKERISRETACG